MPVTTAETTSRSMGAEATDQLAPATPGNEPSIGDAEGRAADSHSLSEAAAQPSEAISRRDLLRLGAAKAGDAATASMPGVIERLSNPDLSGVFQRPVSRRSVLKVSAGLLATAAIAWACGPLAKSSPSQKPDATPPPATATATEAPTSSPTEAPTLSPEQQLQQDAADFLSGKTVLPETGRFHQQKTDKSPLPLGYFETSKVDNSLTNARSQGYLIGIIRVKGADGINYLEAIIGIESAPSPDKKNVRYIEKVNVGGFDTQDEVYIQENATFTDMGSTGLTECGASQAEEILSTHIGQYIVFDKTVMTADVPNYTDTPFSAFEKQNSAAKAATEFDIQAKKQPLENLTVPDAAKKAIITDVNNLSLDEQNPDIASTIPLEVGITLGTPNSVVK